MGKIALNEDLSAKKSLAKKIFGSNLYLSAKKISELTPNAMDGVSPAADENLGKNK